MVSRVKGTHVRPDRRYQDPASYSDVAVTSSGSDCNSCSNPIGFQFAFNESTQTPNLNPNFDANVLDQYNNNQLKDIMLEKLELLYKEAISKLVSLTYDENIVLAAEYGRLESGDSSISFEKDGNVSLEVLSKKNEECTKTILKKFQEMNIEKEIDFVPEDHKDESLVSLVKEIKHLEVQVKQRRKWADEKAVQAARKLCDDNNELNKLRKEREDNEQINQKSILDIDHPTATMKRLIDEEIALREASGQVNRALVIMRRLQVENMRIRAEIVASQLSSSESVTTSSEAAKREKQHLKKILAWEKQRGKLQEDITSENQKLMDLEEEIIQAEAAKNTAEAKWREEQESKKHALSRVKQERRLKEQTESNNKRMHESLRVQIDLDFKCHKDDIQRLEQELSRVKSLTDADHVLTSLFGPDFGDDTIGKLLHGSVDESDDTDDMIDHGCVMCARNDVGVVFLPCEHEVVCVDCNEELKKDECPSCGVVIEQRIRVFDGSS